MTQAQESFDFEWIKDALSKVRSKFSNIASIETDDKIRLVHLVGYLCSRAEYSEYGIYAYDRWTGLTRYDRGQRSFKQESQEGDKYTANAAQATGAGNRFFDLKATLKHMDKMLKTKPTVFVLKELDSVQKDSPDIDKDLTAAFRAWSHDHEIEIKKSVVLIVCGSSSKILDAHTLNQVAIVRPELANATERKIMIEIIARQFKLDLSGCLGSLIQTTAGLTLHQLESILIETYNRTDSFDIERIKEAKSEFIKRSDLLEIEEPRGGFETVGGYEAVKNFVMDNVVRVLKNPARAQRFAIPLPRGILFFGPPGTGKTLFSKALAKDTTLPFINLKTQNLFSKWLGESGQRFEEVIRLAEKMSPAIIFIDEIDRFGKRSQGGGDGASEETRRVFNQILEWLGDEKRKSIIVGTTNRPDDLDEAFIRSGRFDYKIPFLFPDAEARRQILQIHLGITGNKNKPPIALPQKELERVLDAIVDNTLNFSGAEIEQLIIRVKRNAFNRQADSVEEQDFINAVRSFRIDHEKRKEMIRIHLDYARRHTDDEEFLSRLMN
jgi:SpoVK/Ycf46/Vps4 family AAA+-type ATPase